MASRARSEWSVPLSITQTVLTFVAIPAAIVAVIAGLAYAGGSRRNSKRYRPGRPFDFAPVWFLSAPEKLSAATGSAEVTTGTHREALTGSTEPSRSLSTPSAPQARDQATPPAREGATPPAGEEATSSEPRPAGERALQGETGGASDRW